MSCKKTLHTETGCSGRCSECSGARDMNRDRHMNEGPKINIPILAESWPELMDHELLASQTYPNED